MESEWQKYQLLRNALMLIKEECESHDGCRCSECPFERDGDCQIMEWSPDNWDVENMRVKLFGR